MKSIIVYNKNIYTDSCCLKGYMFIGDNLVTQKNAKDFFEGKSFDEISEAVSQANGFFALSINCDDFTAVFTDRIRSIPLYFMEYENNFYISDNCDYLVDISDYDYDISAMDEYRLSGFVSGKYTLLQNIYQMEVSSFLYFKDGKYNYGNYYSMHHTEPLDFDTQKALEELDSCLVNTFERTIRFLEGRTAVIPLSGGQDSRLVVLMLKRLGYNNVITFSYGIKNNSESHKSKLVADQLGYKWIFVEYNKQVWKSYSNRNEFNDYLLYSADYSSYSHVQDWPAVMYLKENSLIPSDSVFIPGHSGDFIAGSHLPQYLDNCKFTFTKNDLLSAVVQKHYSLWPMYKGLKKNILTEKLSKTIGSLPDNMNNIQFGDEFELFDMAERQAKLICNSLRVYDFFGYDYTIPLWDNELIEFWSAVGISHRINRRLYYSYTQKYVYPMLGEIGERLYSDEKTTIDNSFDTPPEYKLKHKKPVWLKLAKRIYYKYIRTRQLFDHPLGWFVIFSVRNKIYYSLKGGESFSSLIVKQYLDLIKKNK